MSVQSRASIAKSKKLVAQALAAPFPDGFDQYLSNNNIPPRASSAIRQPGLGMEDGLTPIRNGHEVGLDADYLDDRGIDDEIMNLNAQLDRANREDDEDDIHSVFTVVSFLKLKLIVRVSRFYSDYEPANLCVRQKQRPTFWSCLICLMIIGFGAYL
jgi:hypothetical protein